MKSDLFKEAFEKAGVISKKIHPGDLWLVSDKLIEFPRDRLPEAKRTPHEERPVVVLTGEEYCQKPGLICILVAPLSHKIEAQSVTDFFIRKGIGNIERDSLVCLDVITPLLKIELKHKIGRLDKKTLDQLRTTLLINLGILQPSQK